MSKKLNILLSFVVAILFIVSAGTVYAQTGSNSRNFNDPRNRVPQRVNTDGAGVVDNDHPEDTTAVKKVKKPKKPLESYYFDSIVTAQPIFAWNLDSYNNDVKFIKIDTLLKNFQIDAPYMIEGVGSAYLGNLGAAAVPINFAERPTNRNFAFLHTMEAYMKTPQNAKFFNSKTAFTSLSFFNAGQMQRADEQLRVLHVQNISPSTGFNLDYTNNATKGQYTNQRAKDKNLSIAFNHTGKRYSVFAGYMYNTATIRENGGVVNDRDITDTIFEQPDIIPVRLEDASNLYKGNSIYLAQSYGFPLQKVTEEDFSITKKTTIFVGHYSEFSKYRKVYKDAETGDFYENAYIDAKKSADTMFESLFENRVYFQLQPFNRKGILSYVDGGIGNEISRYAFYLPSDYQAEVGGNNHTKTSTYLYGAANGYFKKYLRWGAFMKYYMLGDRSGDMTITGNIDLMATIRKRDMTLKAEIGVHNRTPDFWSQHYFSNHFKWQNSFAKETETRIDLKFAIPSVDLEVGANYSLINNKVYFDSLALPAQSGTPVSVMGVYLNKDFRLGGFHMNHRVLCQFSSNNEVVPVPLLTAYLAYYYEFNVVKDVLRVQLGVDARYNTKYYAFGYNPATMQFYNQREKEIGGYPYMGAFVSGKWKRLRILVALKHLNDNLFGERNSFTVLHYPQNGLQLKMGVSWSFYD